MNIRMVTFETTEPGRERLENKITKNLDELKEAPNCLFAEAWYQERKGIIAYTLVSKWASKKDFQNWMKRPEHVERHRQAHLKKKNQEPSAFEIKRTRMEEFSLPDSI